MKKIKTILSLVLLASTLFITSCAYNTPGEYSNKQPYAVQKRSDWSKYACGAFSMAYYLAEQGYIPKKKIASQAKSLYKKVIFPESSKLYPYSDPRKIKKIMSSYASKTEFRMHKIDAQTRELAWDKDQANQIPKEDQAAVLLAEIADMLNYSDSEIVDITDFESALAKDEYAIEIVDADGQVTLPAYYPDDFLRRNSLHYVLTYWKGDTLYSLDPSRGLEEPRSNFIDGTTESWNFCNGGIFIKP